MLRMNLDSTFHFNTTTFTRLLYSLIIVVVVLVALVSEFFIFSQAVRTAPNKEWTRDANIIVIGAAYVLIVCLSSTSTKTAQRGVENTTSFSDSSLSRSHFASNGGCRCA